MKVKPVKVCKKGPKLSKIIQGFWRLADWNMDTKEVVAFLDRCIELGITTFDHADIYGGYTCEAIFGEAFRQSSIPREKVQIVSKCGIKLTSPERPQHRIKSYDTSAEHITQSVDNSLQALNTDYLDVLLIHRPDALMDADEVADTFKHLKKAGKVKYFGVSNFKPFQFDLLQSRMGTPLVTNQLEYSVMNMKVQDDGSLDHCQRLGIKPMAWSPLGGGGLFQSNSDTILHLRAALKKVGDELGEADLDQTALAWILKHPAQFFPILGTGKLERVEKAVNALQLSMTREQWYEIWQASKGHEVP